MGKKSALYTQYELIGNIKNTENIFILKVFAFFELFQFKILILKHIFFWPFTIYFLYLEICITDLEVFLMRIKNKLFEKDL